MAGPAHVVAAPSPFEPARLVPPFARFGGVAPTLKQVALAASPGDWVYHPGRRNGIDEGGLSASY